MNEIRDEKTLGFLRMAVNQCAISLLQNPNERLELRQAFKLTDEIYLVEMAFPNSIVLKGMLLYLSIYNSQIFLDGVSVLSLADMHMEAKLEAFNAGHHWKYKGV